MTGSVCVLGALSCAIFGHADGHRRRLPSGDTSLVDYVFAAIAMQAALGMDDIGYHRLAPWNDHPSRTLEDVLDMLDRAIASAEPSPPGQVPACVAI